MNRALLALLASVVVGSALGESTEPSKIRITTWNLEWFPNGSAKETPAAQQEQRIKEAADVLRPINPDIVLLQEVRDYDACARLGKDNDADRFIKALRGIVGKGLRYAKLIGGEGIHPRDVAKGVRFYR